MRLNPSIPSLQEAELPILKVPVSAKGMWLQGKGQVRMVYVDLSPTYRAIVGKQFSNARSIADRIHVTGRDFGAGPWYPLTINSKSGFALLRSDQKAGTSWRQRVQVDRFRVGRQTIRGPARKPVWLASAAEDSDQHGQRCRLPDKLYKKPGYGLDELRAHFNRKFRIA